MDSNSLFALPAKLAKRRTAFYDALRLSVYACPEDFDKTASIVTRARMGRDVDVIASATGASSESIAEALRLMDQISDYGRFLVSSDCANPAVSAWTRTTMLDLQRGLENLRSSEFGI